MIEIKLYAKNKAIIGDKRQYSFKKSNINFNFLCVLILNNLIKFENIKIKIKIL